MKKKFFISFLASFILYRSQFGYERNLNYPPYLPLLLPLFKFCLYKKKIVIPLPEMKMKNSKKERRFFFECVKKPVEEKNTENIKKKRSEEGKNNEKN